MNHDGGQPAGVPSIRFPVFEFFVLFVPVAILVLVMGFSFASLRTESEIEAVLEYDDTILRQVTGFVAAQVSGSLNHLLVVSGETATRRALDDADTRSLRRLEDEFLTLARRNPYYQQIRWIDETGRERVRVSRDGKETTVVPTGQLQDKSDRYYFNAAKDLLPGELYISRMDLNVEHGKIEYPYRPVLRIAIPVEDSRRRRRGIIIFNLAMKHLFDALNQVPHGRTDVRYLLLNHEGQILKGLAGLAPNLAGDQGVVDFAKTHARLWDRVKASPSGSVELGDGLWSWDKLAPADIFRTMRHAFPEHATGVHQLVSDQFGLVMVANRPVQALLEIRRDSRMLVSLGALLVLAIYAISIYLYLSSHVRERRAKLMAGYAVARAEHLEQVRQLEERFHRLFEASTVGQLVVNGEGRIELANAAAQQTLGYDPGQLIGLAVDALVPRDQRPDHARLRTDYLRAPQAREMGKGRKLEALTRHGQRVPVEIGLNPYMDADKQMVLVSIIDLSTRDSAPDAV